METTNIGRYQLIRKIGQGGMATVYLAQDPTIDREVAIKLLSTPDAELYQRFLQEARLIARLDHSSIVPIYDVGLERDRPYLVMRFMRGGTLEDRLKEGALPLQTVNIILQRVCSGLAKAHANGIVHRDLKPGNILFDADDNAYLADFGIARLADATQTNSFMGTPYYMAPEQFTGETLDARTDIYQLGIVLFEMLTGSEPFKVKTPAELLYHHLYSPLPALSSEQEGLPEALDTVLQRCTEKFAAQRYESVDKVADDFEAALAGSNLSIAPVAEATQRPAAPAPRSAAPASRLAAPAPRPSSTSDNVAARVNDRPQTAAPEHIGRSLNPLWILAGLITLLVILASVVAFRSFSAVPEVQADPADEEIVGEVPERDLEEDIEEDAMTPDLLNEEIIDDVPEQDYEFETEEECVDVLDDPGYCALVFSGIETEVVGGVPEQDFEEYVFETQEECVDVLDDPGYCTLMFFGIETEADCNEVYENRELCAFIFGDFWDLDSCNEEVDDELICDLWDKRALDGEICYEVFDGDPLCAEYFGYD